MVFILVFYITAEALVEGIGNWTVSVWKVRKQKEGGKE